MAYDNRIRRMVLALLRLAISDAEFYRFYGQSIQWIDRTDPRIADGDLNDPSFRQWLMNHVETLKHQESRQGLPKLNAIVKPVTGEFGLNNLDILDERQHRKAIWTINNLVEWENHHKTLDYEEPDGMVVQLGAPNIEPVVCGKDSKTKQKGMSPFYRTKIKVTPPMRVVYRWENQQLVIYGIETRSSDYEICKYLP